MTKFVTKIQELPIASDRAKADIAGNSIVDTYATKSDIENVVLTYGSTPTQTWDTLVSLAKKGRLFCISNEHLCRASILNTAETKIRFSAVNDTTNYFCDLNDTLTWNNSTVVNFATTSQLETKQDAIVEVKLEEGDDFIDVVYSTAKILGSSCLFYVTAKNSEVAEKVTNLPPNVTNSFRAECFTLWDGVVNSSSKAVVIQILDSDNYTLVSGKLIKSSTYPTPTIFWHEHQLALTFDSTPKVNSNNPVTSDGIYKSIAQRNVFSVNFGSTNTYKFTSTASASRTFYLKIDNGNADTEKMSVSIMPQNTSYVNFHSRINSGTESFYTAQRNTSTSYTVLSNFTRSTSFAWWEADIANGDALVHIVCFAPYGYAAKIFTNGAFTVVTVSASDSTELNPAQGSTELS